LTRAAPDATVGGSMPRTPNAVKSIVSAFAARIRLR
jgi:hypothetical protein